MLSFLESQSGWKVPTDDSSVDEPTLSSAVFAMAGFAKISIAYVADIEIITIGDGVTVFTVKVGIIEAVLAECFIIACMAFSAMERTTAILTGNIFVMTTFANTLFVMEGMW